MAVTLAAALERNTFFGRTLNGPIAQFDPALSDFIVYRLFRPPPATGQVAIAAIDDRSIAELGRFPWPRSIEARLVRALHDAGATVIAFDMIFSERDPGDLEREALDKQLQKAGVSPRLIKATADESGDRAFAAAIQTHGQVLLGYAFNPHLSWSQRNPPVDSSPPLDPPAWHYDLVSEKPGARRTVATAYSYVAPFAILRRAVRGLAYVDIDEDEADDKVRSYPAVVFSQGRYCAPLFLAAAQIYLNNALLSLRLGPGGVIGMRLGDRDIPVDEMGRMMIHYRGAPGTLPQYSVADIIYGRIPAGSLHGKIVLVGVTAHGLGDRFITPVAGDFPGVALQATAIDNVLRGDFIYQTIDERGEEKWSGWILGTSVGIATALAGAGASFALVLMLTIGYLGYVAYRFETSGAMVGVMFPVAAMTFSYLAAVSYRYRIEGKDRRDLRSAFEKYLHPAVLDAVMRDPDGLKLGGQRQELSVLFADIIGFTQRAERTAPEPLVAMLNTYMSAMISVILRSGGVVNKLMGDGIMAFWGPPLKMGDHARAALNAALDMLQELKSLSANDERFRDVRIGIGIATGYAVVGNLGGEQYLDYSAVGDTVNLASRIEGLTRRFQVNLLVNQAALEEAGEGFITRAVGLVKVKGRDQIVKIFEIIGHEGEGIDHSYYERFTRMVTKLSDGDRSTALRELLSERPDDPVAALYLTQLEVAERRGDPELVFEFDGK